ncbi:S8 family serine peptidase [Candidatus Uabimicrobium sp. HlEnr_7]|uniref:S8 family peptidase n=1 Tax=Candidatus Uabimicrobium helgolandensis TaxID=3095367 RepID=UPI00355933E2
MQKFLSILLVLAVCATPMFADAIIGQDLQNAMNTERGDLQVIVTLKKDANVEATRGANKAQVLDVLAQQCEADQHFVKGLCAKLQSEGTVSEIVQFDMSNCISIKAASSAVQELALHSDIYSLTLDAEQTMIDPLAGEEVRATWGLNHIRAAQNKGHKGDGVVVAIVDTGIQTNHSGFAPGQVIKSKCKSFISGEGIEDGNGHGTHCAGTVGSPQYGVATGAKLIGVKVLSASGSGSWTSVAGGVEYAAKNADVISMSLGGTDNGFDNPAARAVRNAIAAGIPCAIAAGNSGASAKTIGTPGCEKPAITVGAIQQGGTIARFSSRGPTQKGLQKPDITAPGVNVMSLWIGNGTRSISGTSMATPHVAGLCAVLLSANSGMNPAAIKKVLMSTAKGTKQVNVHGEGCIDVPNALNATMALVEMGVNTRGNASTMRLEKEIEVDIVDGNVNFTKDIDAPFEVTITGLKADFSCDNAVISIDGNVVKEGAVKANVKEKVSVKVSGGKHAIQGKAAGTSKKNGKGTIVVTISLW